MAARTLVGARVDEVDWRDDVWRRFREDLPGFAVIWVGVMAIAVVLQMIDGRGSSNPFEVVLAMTVMALALTPVIWIRHEIPLIRGRHHSTRRTFAVIGVGCLWAVVALLGGTFLLALLGIQ